MRLKLLLLPNPIIWSNIPTFSNLLPMNMMRHIYCKKLKKNLT